MGGPSVTDVDDQVASEHLHPERELAHDGGETDLLVSSG